jgi:hypothetical protein
LESGFNTHDRVTGIAYPIGSTILVLVKGSAHILIGPGIDRGSSRSISSELASSVAFLAWISTKWDFIGLIDAWAQSERLRSCNAESSLNVLNWPEIVRQSHASISQAREFATRTVSSSGLSYQLICYTAYSMKPEIPMRNRMTSKLKEQ